MARKLYGPERKIRLFLVDDEAVVRRGLRLLLSAQADLDVCGEAAGGHEALRAILALNPDLAIVDLSLKEGDGVVLIRHLRKLRPGLRLLVFSMHGQAHFAATAFAAGADGYVLKEEGTERLFDAIHLVMQGKSYLSAQIATKAPALAARAASRGRTRAS